MKSQYPKPVRALALSVGILGVGLLLIGCGGQTPIETVKLETDYSLLSPTLIVAKLPANALGVVAARQSVHAGADVIISGFVGGRVDPFVDGRAVLTLGDAKELQTCDKEGEGCQSPWDACCEAPEKINASIATIQVIDADGQVVKTGLKGFGGIQELAMLTVKGKIAEGSNSEVLIVNAEQFYIGSPRAGVSQ